MGPPRLAFVPDDLEVFPRLQSYDFYFVTRITSGYNFVSKKMKSGYAPKGNK